ncbi:MAG: hypothetical protein HW379_1185 [Actinobacteria bacterium]|nr:hypothetical protein [Actinomycetota bacterium]
MKYRRSAGLLLSSILLFVGAPTAMAHELPSPSPVPGIAPLNELEQYKLALEHFRSDSIEFRKIANRFTTAINRANGFYEAAMRSAKNDRARTNITAQRDSSIEIAINMRDAAIAEMGGAPVEPTKPVKPIATATTKKTKVNSPSPTPSP